MITGTERNKSPNPAVAAAAEALAPTSRQIPLADLVPQTDSPRFVVGKAAMKELTASIKSNGILQNLVARPHPTQTGKFEVRAGCRRLEAATTLGVLSVSVLVREMTDAQAAEVTAVENLHRLNPHPLEEAAAIHALLERAGWDYDAIAAHFGKAKRWVVRRAQLAHLSNSWRDAAIDPKTTVSQFSAGHFECIARLPKQSQEEMFAAHKKHGNIRGQWARVPKVADLWAETTPEERSLDGMPWKSEDGTVLPEVGACTDCQKRTGCQRLLWDDPPEKAGKGPKDQCLDEACYQRKMGSYLLARHSDVTQRLGLGGKVGAVDFVAGEWTEGSKALAKKLGRTIVSRYKYNPVPKNTAGAKPAIIATGTTVGKLIYIHGTAKAAVAKPETKGAGTPKTLQERRTALSLRRCAFVVSAVRDRIEKLKPAEYDELANPERSKVLLIAAILAFGTHHRFDSLYGSERPAWTRYDAYVASCTTTGALTGDVLRSVAQVWVSRLRFSNNQDQLKQRAKEAKRMAGMLGIDYTAIEQEATMKIPEPKGWAKLKADGSPKAAPAKPKRSTPPAKTKPPARAAKKNRCSGNPKRSKAAIKTVDVGDDGKQPTHHCKDCKAADPNPRTGKFRKVWKSLDQCAPCAYVTNVNSRGSVQQKRRGRASTAKASRRRRARGKRKP